jgi:hypothetical protein
VFPSAGDIKSNGDYDYPGSGTGNPRYSMWAKNAKGQYGSAQAYRRRIDSNNDGVDKYAGCFVRCVKE